jgi:adenylate kinase
MNIILLGPQGSGKGTQARLLGEKFGFFYIASGDVLRSIAKTNPEIAATMKAGRLIPDEQTFNFMLDNLRENNVKDNVLFDGFPRSSVQFELFEKNNFPIHLVLLIRISDEEAIRRLSARRMHKTTGEIYNLITNPPPEGVKSEDLIQREDDRPEAIKTRLAIFHSVTEELISDLERSGIDYAEVDGQRPIKQIHEELVEIIERSPEFKSISRHQER